MLKERPILRQYRGPAVAAATAPPSTGGEDLSELIAQADALRRSLVYTWSDLTSLCGEDSKTLDRRGLVRLIGLLGTIQRQGPGQLPLPGGAIDG